MNAAGDKSRAVVVTERTTYAYVTTAAGPGSAAAHVPPSAAAAPLSFNELLADLLRRAGVRVSRA
jgi:hypothetical protein